MSAPHLSPDFPQFALLPPEIQLQIWEASCSGPSMHIFDACFTSWEGDDRSRRAFYGSVEGPLSETDHQRYTKFKGTLFLDGCNSDPRTSSTTEIGDDPSMYKWKKTLQETCVDASNIAALRTRPEVGRSEQPTSSDEVSTVYLPGPNRYVHYDNSIDVLHLRFGQSNQATTRDPKNFVNIMHAIDEKDPKVTSNAISPCLSKGEAAAGGINAVLDGLWSAEMTDTVQAARRVALEMADVWNEGNIGPWLMEEVVFLACTLQHNLEVLYLVDYCPGRCKGCGRENLRAKELQTRGGELDRELHGNDKEELKRGPDVIQGVGTVYREVFELEKLGWDDYHPSYIFAKVIDDAIRSQQRDGMDNAVFNGVRILVAEDEVIGGRHSAALQD